MTTYAVRFNTDDRHKIEPLLDFVKSLDFVSSVEIASEEPAPNEEAPTPAPLNGQFLPIEEIRRLYPNEWVLLAEPRKKGIEILGGTVLLHESDKRSMALRAKDLIRKYSHVTHFFTGDIPKRATIGLMRKTQS